MCINEIDVLWNEHKKESSFANKYLDFIFTLTSQLLQKHVRTSGTSESMD